MEEKALIQLQESSPFRQLFKKIYEKVLKSTSASKYPNSYYLPDIVENVVYASGFLVYKMMIYLDDKRQTKIIFKTSKM